MSKTEYLVAEKNNKCFLKLAGVSNYQNCSAFNDFINEIVKKQKFDEILLDLSELEFIDSTNLGILAKCTQYLYSRHNRKAVIYSVNENINEILKSVGFYDAFTIIDDKSNVDSEFQKLETEVPVDKEKLGIILLNAHRALMEMNDKNKEVFTDVVKMLEKDTKK